jgi:hypothetical protein
MKHNAARSLVMCLILISVLSASVVTGHGAIQAARPQRIVIRDQDVAIADPVTYVTGIWTAPPSGRATAGPVYYAVEVVCPIDGGPPATIGFGFLDQPGFPEPVMASFCGDCYDSARGAPPPPGDWFAYGNHGPLREMVRFEISYDPLNSRWSWYLNGRFVRSEQSKLLGAGVRVSAGVTTNASEVVRELWHNDIQTHREHAGWQLFEPNDDRWPQVIVDGGTVGYEPSGTVVVASDEIIPTHPNEVSVPVERRGGGGGPVVNLVGSRQMLAARGADLVVIDLDRTNVSVIQRLTSTITSIAVLPNGILVGTHDGTITRLDPTGKFTAGGRINVAAPISTLAVGMNDALAGTTEGDVFRIALESNLSSLDRIELSGPVRSLLWHDGQWLAGVESHGHGVPPGQLYKLNYNGNGQLIFDVPIGMTSPPVVLVPVEPDVVLVATSGGEIRRYRIVVRDLVDDGRLLLLPANVNALVGSARRWYVTSESGEVWGFTIDEAGKASVIAQGSLGVLCIGVGFKDGRLVVTSDAGEVSVFGVAELLSSQPLLNDIKIGSVSGVVGGDDSIVVLAGHYSLQWLDAGMPGLPLSGVSGLPRRAITLRPRPGGVALANGYSGVDLYDWHASGSVSHLRVGGISRDVVFADNAAYVASGTIGVHVVDLRDIEQPAIAVTLTTDRPAIAVAIRGQQLLVGQQGGNVLVFERTSALAPRLVGEVQGTPSVERFVVRDNEVVGVTHSGMVFYLDSRTIGPSGTPYLSSAFRVSRCALDVVSIGQDLLVASADDGVQRIQGANMRVDNVRAEWAGPVMALGTSDPWSLVGLGPGGLAWWLTRPNGQLYFPLLADQSP